MARRLRFPFFLPRPRVVVRNEPVYPVSTDIVLGAVGDSMTDQQTDPGLFENCGYINALQLVTGQRYVWNNSLNFGVSGEKTGDIAARRSVFIAAMKAAGVTECIYHAGPNDRRGKFSAQYSIDNTALVLSDLRAAGINVTIITTFPATDNFYATKNTTLYNPTQIAEIKADVLTFNAWIRQQATVEMPNVGPSAAPKVRVVEGYDAMVDAFGNAIAANLNDDELHPNATGGWRIMERLYDVLTPEYGVREFTLHPNNKLPNPNFSGTGGTVNATRETGVLASNYITVGTAPAGTPASRTYAKTLKGQSIAVAFPSGGSTRDNQRTVGRYTSSVDAGKSAYAEFEARVTDIGSGTGVWHALSAEVQTSVGSIGIGYDRGGQTTEKVPVDLMKAFCDSRRRTLLFRTPVGTIQAGATYTEGRMNIECDTTAGARSGAIEILNAQLVIQ